MRAPCVSFFALCTVLHLAAQAVPTGAPVIEYLSGDTYVQLRYGDSFEILGIPFQVWGPDTFLIAKSEDGQYFTQWEVKDGKVLTQLSRKGNVVMSDIPYYHAFCGSRRLICFSEDEIFSIGLPSLKKEWTRKLGGSISTMIDVDETNGLISICRSDWIVTVIKENGDAVGDLRLSDNPVTAFLGPGGEVIVLTGDFNYEYSLEFFDGSDGRRISRESLGADHCLRPGDIYIDRGTRSRILFNGYCSNEELLCFDLGTKTLARRERDDTYGPCLGYWKDKIIATRCNMFEIDVMDNALNILKTVRFREVQGNGPAVELAFSRIVWTPQGVALWLTPTYGCK